LHNSQRVLLALTEAGLPRQAAYELVQAHAMRAWEEERDFAALLRADDAVAGRIDLDAVLDLSAYTRHVDTIFERLEALRKEPVHA
jgi:adenylosuccinate lyase